MASEDKLQQGGEAQTGARAASGARTASPRRLGRKVAWVLYFAALGFIAVTATVQITQQIFFPDPPADAPPFSTCREGLIELYRAIERGRKAAEDRSENDRSDEAALQRYRQAVDSVWQHRDRVEVMCQDDPEHQRALDSIERLRYSEEHGVRSQESELALLRRQARRIVDSVLQPD